MANSNWSSSIETIPAEITTDLGHDQPAAALNDQLRFASEPQLDQPHAAIPAPVRRARAAKPAAKPSKREAAAPPPPGSLLEYGALRTEQLKYLNLQRLLGMEALRSRIRKLEETVERERDYSIEIPAIPELRGRSIRVTDLRYMFKEDTHCKWCGEELTLGTLTLTFDYPIVHGGSPNIENVVAICRHCFFHKGFYPQWFWQELMGWLLTDKRLLEAFRKYSPTWSKKAAYVRYDQRHKLPRKRPACR